MLQSSADRQAGSPREGEAVIVEPHDSTRFRSVARAKKDAWPTLAMR